MTRVLVARLDNCGDVLLAGPAVRAVAAAAGHVTLLCGPRGVPAARLLPGVDDLLVHRAPWIDPEPPPVDRTEVERLVEEVRARRADRAVVFTSFHQSPLPLALVLRLAGVPHVAAISVDYPGSLLDVRHRVGDDVHEVERALSLVAAAGFELPPDDDGRLQVELTGTTGSPVGGFPAASGTDPVRAPYVVVHPGASVPARAWHPDHHAALVAELARRGRTVVVTGAPDEAGLTSAVAATAAGAARGAPGRVVDLGGGTDFAGLGRLLAGADVLVSGNTGPAHLAAAVDTPVVSLFAPTVPAVRWRPWKVAHVLLGDLGIGCAGCRARVCPVEGHPCIDDVPVHAVVEAVDTLAPTAREPAVGTTTAVQR